MLGRDEDDYVDIEMKDDGNGMQPEQLERIFEPFFSSKSTGVGIGLAISRSIIESHNGRIWADSTPGVGATFRIKLPAGCGKD